MYVFRLKSSDIMRRFSCSLQQNCLINKYSLTAVTLIVQLASHWGNNSSSLLAFDSVHLRWMVCSLNLFLSSPAPNISNTQHCKHWYSQGSQVSRIERETHAFRSYVRHSRHTSYLLRWKKLSAICFNVPQRANMSWPRCPHRGGIKRSPGVLL